MQRFSRILSILIVILILALSLLSCSETDKDDNSADINTPAIDNQIDPNSDVDVVPERNGIVFKEEDDGVVIEKAPSDPSQYIGKWEATSDKSNYLYGNIEIEVYQNGTWAAVITDEKLTGKWTDNGDHLRMEGDFFSFDLAFDKNGKLIMIETGEDYVLNTVLTKK